MTTSQIEKALTLLKDKNFEGSIRDEAELILETCMDSELVGDFVDSSLEREQDPRFTLYSALVVGIVIGMRLQEKDTSQMN